MSSQLQLALVQPDFVRMGRQRSEIWEAMLEGRWVTLAELENATGHPQASISARLRDFRQAKFGAHTVERRRRYGPACGTWEYRLTPRL